MKRLELTDPNGRKLTFFVNATSVVEIQEAGVSQRWHGVQNNVRVGDSNWHEVRESTDEIGRQLAQ